MQLRIVLGLLAITAMILGCTGARYNVVNKRMIEAVPFPEFFIVVWNSDSSAVRDLQYSTSSVAASLKRAKFNVFGEAFINEIKSVLKYDYQYSFPINFLNMGKVSISFTLVELHSVPSARVSSVMYSKSDRTLPSPSESEKRAIDEINAAWSSQNWVLDKNSGVGKVMVVFTNLSNQEIGRFQMNSKGEAIKPEDVSREINKCFEERNNLKTQFR